MSEASLQGHGFVPVRDLERQVKTMHLMALFVLKFVRFLNPCADGGQVLE